MTKKNVYKKNQNFDKKSKKEKKIKKSQKKSTAFFFILFSFFEIIKFQNNFKKIKKTKKLKKIKNPTRVGAARRALARLQPGKDVGRVVAAMRSLEKEKKRKLKF